MSPSPNRSKDAEFKKQLISRLKKAAAALQQTSVYDIIRDEKLMCHKPRELTLETFLKNHPSVFLFENNVVSLKRQSAVDLKGFVATHMR